MKRIKDYSYARFDYIIEITIKFYNNREKILGAVLPKDDMTKEEINDFILRIFECENYVLGE